MLATIALGSNLGDRQDHLARAAHAIAALDGVTVTARSRLYETAPVGGPDNQGPFLNAALAVDTALQPAQLLAALHRIEAEHERVRQVRWGPRTLDLDLLTHGETVIDSGNLTVPHPRLAERHFVLAPLADIVPDLVHPVSRRTIADLLDTLEDRDPLLRLVAAPEDWSADP